MINTFEDNLQEKEKSLSEVTIAIPSQLVFVFSVAGFELGTKCITLYNPFFCRHKLEILQDGAS